MVGVGSSEFTRHLICNQRNMLRWSACISRELPEDQAKFLNLHAFLKPSYVLQFPVG